LKFTLEYTNYGLIEKTGALYDIYASGLDKDTVFETSSQTFDFNTNITIDQAIFPEQNFALPAATEITNVSATQKKYSYNKQSILGKTIWIQMGRKQYYHFKLLQKTEPTMQSNLGLQNEYQIVLPRDVDNAELYQKVYFDKIFPLPSRTEKDADGNLIAYFNVSSFESGEITVEGFVEVGLTQVKVNSENSGALSDLAAASVASYLKPAEFWEVSAPEIQAAASEIKKDTTNVYSLISDTFSYVTNKINYNEVKRFGLNERQGALATLKIGSGVCMEYSDLFLTLARAQGLPTRAVFGYGYDPKEGSSTQETHQWVESYIPKLDKWLDIDVTWGDSGKAAEGAYLNHFYTHIVTASPDALPEISVKSFGSSSNLSLPKYDINAVITIPQDSIYLSQEQILKKYPNTITSGISQLVLEIPLRIGAFFGNISNKDALSIALFTVGFALIIVPTVLVLRKRIDFGSKAA
jgi:transglutaminase-like putative cysteine protease